MYSKVISRALPEQVFVSVYNNSTNTMSVGHAVLWDYQTNTVQTSGYVTGNGYAVTFARTVATTQHHPGHFAGVVAVRDIQGGDYGVLQCYGEVASVYVSGGASSAPYLDATIAGGGSTIWTDSSVHTIILRPAGLHGITTGAATNFGYMGIMSLSTTLTNIGTVTTLDLRPFHHGGYAVPLGPLMNASGTSATITYTSSGTCKAFIHCMQ